MDGTLGNFILLERSSEELVQGPILEEFRATVAPLAAKTRIFQKNGQTLIFAARGTRVVGNAS